jgi:tetratricopeptide (TPR) repeat protein
VALPSTEASGEIAPLSLPLAANPEPANRQIVPAPVAPPAALVASRQPEPKKTGSSPAAATSQTTAPGAWGHAQALLAQGDFARAAAELRRSADTEPRFAEHAQYELSTILHDNLHEREAALTALRQYRLRYPNGTFLVDVDFALVRIEIESGHQDETLAEATRFLSAHAAEQDKADQVRLLRAELFRRRGELPRAIEDYRAVSQPSHVEDALVSLVWCQKQLGDRLGATKALNDYLARFPHGRHADDARRALRDE